MIKKTVLVNFLIISILQVALGQGFNGPGQLKDDGKFSASTKQVNQFFRRFNAEESKDGYKRYYPDDKEYRNIELRKNFINILEKKSCSILDFK